MTQTSMLVYGPTRAVSMFCADYVDFCCGQQPLHVRPGSNVGESQVVLTISGRVDVDKLSAHNPELTFSVVPEEHHARQSDTLNDWQLVALSSYNQGDHLCDPNEPGSIENCGDGLLTFVMQELASSEGCTDFDVAEERLSKAIQQLEEVRAALSIRAYRH